MNKSLKSVTALSINTTQQPLIQKIQMQAGGGVVAISSALLLWVINGLVQSGYKTEEDEMLLHKLHLELPGVQV